MPDSFRSETIANWVSDFADTPAYEQMTPPAKEFAQEILPAFLQRACRERDVQPAELGESDLKPGLLDGVGSIELPASARQQAPELCAVFLGEMEARGWLAEGTKLGLYVRALRGAFEEQIAPQPVRNPGARIGRNDPCPCGSGKKYKRCCMNRTL
jgi:hypothetical protein